jgi:hypothetical protein
VWYIVCGFGRLLVLVLVLGVVVVVRSSVVGRHEGGRVKDGSLDLIHFGYLSANDVVYDFCIQEFEYMEFFDEIGLVEAGFTFLSNLAENGGFEGRTEIMTHDIYR